MAITSLNLNQQSDLEFSVAVQGANGDNATTRFCIITEDKEIGFTGKIINGTVKFNIPKLEQILEAGTYDCKLEIIVGEYYFSPINETIEFKMPVSVREAKVIADVPKEKPSVSINKITVQESASADETTTSAEAETTKSGPAKAKITLGTPAPKQYKIAKLVAETLKYSYKPTQSPVEIINESLSNSPGTLPKSKASLLNNMLKAAKEANIEFDKDLLSNIKIL